MKRSSLHCPRCGRWAGDVLCQCRINQVRKEIIAGQQMELCLKAAERRELDKAWRVAEVCGEVGQ